MDAVFTDKCGTALRQDGTRFENARGDLSERTRKFAPDVIQFTESLPRDETTRILARQLLRAGTVEFGRSPYVTARKHGHPERSAVERTAPAVTARSRRSPLSHERRESNVTPLPRSARPSPTTINPHRHNGRATSLQSAGNDVNRSEAFVAANSTGSIRLRSGHDRPPGTPLPMSFSGIRDPSLVVP